MTLSLLRNAVRSHFVSSRIQRLHLTIIGPFVRHVERAQQRTAVRVLAARVEELFVDFPVEIVDRVVEREHDQLRDLRRLQSARNRRRAAVAVRKIAILGLALGGGG